MIQLGVEIKRTGAADWEIVDHSRCEAFIVDNRVRELTSWVVGHFDPYAFRITATLEKS